MHIIFTRSIWIPSYYTRCSPNFTVFHRSILVNVCMQISLVPPYWIYDFKLYVKIFPVCLWCFFLFFFPFDSSGTIGSGWALFAVFHDESTWVSHSMLLICIIFYDFHYHALHHHWSRRSFCFMIRNVVSFSDGQPDKGSGIPYFYLTTLDPTASYALKDQRSSFTISEYSIGTCGSKDPENPSCAKITLIGKVACLLSLVI